MKELITNSQDMKERQIKGERQLNELTNSINEKFEELEKDKKRKRNQNKKFRRKRFINVKQNRNSRKILRQPRAVFA